MLQHWPDRWPNLKRLMGTGRELPQRDHRVVPGGHRVRARDDRHRHVPEPARHHRPQHPRRQQGAEGVRRRGPREPRRHPDPHARRPVERRDGQPRVGRRDRLSGVAHGHDRLRRLVTDRGPAPGGRLLGRGRVQARTASARGRRTTPSCSGCRRPCPASTSTTRTSRRSTVPGMGSLVRSAGTSDTVLRAARRALPGRPDRGDAAQRADRAEWRHGPPLHQLQGTGLHRSHLQHEVGVGGPRAARGRRAARAPGRHAR